MGKASSGINCGVADKSRSPPLALPQVYKEIHAKLRWQLVGVRPVAFGKAAEERLSDLKSKVNPISVTERLRSFSRRLACSMRRLV